MDYQSLMKLKGVAVDVWPGTMNGVGKTCHVLKEKDPTSDQRGNIYIYLSYI